MSRYQSNPNTCFAKMSKQPLDMPFHNIRQPYLVPYKDVKTIFIKPCYASQKYPSSFYDHAVETATTYT